MRVKTRRDGFLALDLGQGTFETAVRESMSEKRYVEAFALLHSWIDYLMWECLTFYGAIHRNALPSFDNVRFERSLRDMKKKRLINHEQCQRLRDFNEARNKIVHRLVYNTLAYAELLEKPDKIRITDAEAKSALREGLRLATMLEHKVRKLWTKDVMSPERKQEGFQG